MEQNTINAIIAFGGLIGTLVTAVATFFLWRVTKVLAYETTRMVEANSQPHVVATLDVNRWSMRHFDVNVSNTGNGTAYDISIDFSPSLQNGEGRGEKEIPLRKISVLKPGQEIGSYLSDFTPLKDKIYKVTITWRRNMKDAMREENIYLLNMQNIDGISRLGNDPLVQIADHVKKLQEDLHPVMRGSTRIKFDAFLASDRLHERRVADRARRRWQQQHTVPTVDVPETPASAPP